MRRSYELEIQIPKDLSVIGFDNIRLAQFSLASMTIVQMSQSELASMAFDSLISEVGRKEPSTRGAEYELRTALVLRKSTAVAIGGNSNNEYSFLSLGIEYDSRS